MMSRSTVSSPGACRCLAFRVVGLLTVCGVFTFRTIFDLAKTSDTEMVINVTGQQWWWEYDYPVQTELGIKTPIITSGQLVLPVGTKVLLRETSRDVIHSYWIPALNGKKDAVPGRIHENKLEADKPGYYSGQCTEFCGLSHANMRQWAVALSAEDFATWVENQQKPATAYAETDESPEARGYRAFRQNCSRCHQVNGMQNADGTPTIAAPENNIVAGAAPNLTHLMTATEADLRESLFGPNPGAEALLLFPKGATAPVASSTIRRCFFCWCRFLPAHSCMDIIAWSHGW